MTIKEKVEQILDDLEKNSTIHSNAGYEHTRDSIVLLIEYEIAQAIERLTKKA